MRLVSLMIAVSRLALSDSGTRTRSISTPFFSVSFCLADAPVAFWTAVTSSCFGAGVFSPVLTVPGADVGASD